MASAELKPGESFGPYRLESVLGRGAIGLVFRAEQDDGTVVALKILRAELVGDAVFERRFAREARVAREVDHPNVVQVLDAGEVDGRCFLAMRYVHGRSLGEQLATDGPRQIVEVARLAAELGGALDALHLTGLVHRDVKPANILLDESGVSALTDFGLAKGRAYTVLTRPGQILGTVDYLAPEVIRGDGAGPASDIYGLGCVLYACLTGKAPFADPSPFRVTFGHLEEEPADPCAWRDDAPADLSQAILSALAKEPAERPPTARALALAVWRAAAATAP